jgi:CheY-like chemotaxis protein
MDENASAVEMDFTDVSFTKPPVQLRAMPSAAQADSADREALTVTSELKRSGAYVSIARRAKNLAPVRPERKYRLLLIDDDPQLVAMMSRMLAMSGYSVRTASNREELINELGGPMRPDLVLLDVQIGELNGFNILVRLRRHARLSGVPVIMLTAHATRKDVTRGLLAGADGYVSKPCQFVVLNRAIRTVLDIASQAS